MRLEPANRIQRLIRRFPLRKADVTHAVTLAFLLPLTGCAIRYYDKQSGTEHLWGFGHMKMKVAPPDEGVQAVVKGTSSLGLDIGAGQDDYRIAAGWYSRRQIIVSSNAAVRFEWPNGDFFKVRVGTLPPFATNSFLNDTKSNNEQ